ncbi:complex I NDUFA9 subunit family protein [Lichenicola cladoniae]|uniref:Complex I NDUFA9 subunit family protein n=1 Tax=Lichenicola cladoniae TaxID=1484109 RepID=A0A6M8HPZ6_9PROT|nr:complex I NDUFA9 subunit family protein [Lichenicola cladoniae]NPD66430.1 complex I NDUFA9 subunit family protein [Acetobacteraceae bacterium]QKE90335.1 complex I NDUFA9 subunit family protein [Lichenicola cladoniae]
MATRSVATVFGGSGFLGRYIVRRLAADGHVVRVAARHTASANALRMMGRVGQVVPMFASLADEASVARALEGTDIVVNLVGILAEARRGDFRRVHEEGAGRIARLAAVAGTTRLVQMSAIGADPDSPSAYGKSKAGGEAAVRAAFPSATILRPSVVFGPEDAFFNRFGAMARLSPIMPVFSGETKLQPVYAGDVADAVRAVVQENAPGGGLYELGGPRVWSFRELLAWMLAEMHRKRPLISVPMGLARIQAALLEHVPGKPLTRDQLAMLSRDNVVAAGAADLETLGIVPTPVELVVPSYIARYRPGGGRKEELD